MEARFGGYRYRIGGRESRRVQRSGFASERDAGEALERPLARLRQANGTASTLTFARLVDEYLAQHDAQPETIEKLRWLLAKAVRAFGDQRLGQFRAQEIAVWRMTIGAWAIASRRPSCCGRCWPAPSPGG